MSRNRRQSIPSPITIPPTLHHRRSSNSISVSKEPDSPEAENLRLTAPLDQPAGAQPEHLRRQYENSDSPLKKGGDALASAGRKLRRVSVRVVNLAGIDVPNRGASDSGGDSGQQRREGMKHSRARSDAWNRIPSPPPPMPPSMFVVSPDAEEPAPPMGPLRGTTLGFLSSQSKLRLAMYNLLIWT